jgi:exonuclease III
MIVATFNVRGLRGGSKKRKIRDLLRQHKIDFMAIQETKMEDVSASFCATLWGDDDFDWAFLPSEGASGGILSIWRKSMTSVFYTFT